jgi:isopentenyldiphosphate isomerase
MSFLDHIHACNRWQPQDFAAFVVRGEALGCVRRDFAANLVAIGDDFRIQGGALHWVSAPEGFDALSEAMAGICSELVRRGLISHLHGERYPVTPGPRDDVRFLIDRACAPYFGIRAFGQHLNGYVRRADGLYLWVARRSASRRVYPNRLDNLVAGGLPWGIDLRDNLRKECFEEASMPASVADQAVPVGAISYCRDSDRGLKPDVIYCYDLELDADFEPRCNDDEVAGFSLWPIQQVMSLVAETDEFKLNCNLVIIDFLIRHGLLGPEHPQYLELVQGLRAPLPNGPAVRS